MVYCLTKAFVVILLLLSIIMLECLVSNRTQCQEKINGTQSAWLSKKINKTKSDLKFLFDLQFLPLNKVMF